MARFGSDITEAPSANSAETPVPGVVTNSPDQPVDRSGLVNSFALAGETFNKVKKGSNDEKLAQFNRNIIKVADSYQQGGIKSSSEANARIRRLLIDALDSTDDPELQAQYVASQRSLMGLSGGAAIIDKRTEEENNFRAIKSSLIMNNIIRPDASDTEVQNKIDESILAKQAMLAQQAEIASIDRQLKDLSLENAQRTSLENRRHDASIEGFRKSAPIARDGFQKTLEEILRSQELDDLQKVNAINDAYQNFKDEISPLASHLNTEERNFFLSGFEETRDLYLELAKGTISEELAKNKLETIMAKTKASMLVKDPALAISAAAGDLFGNYDLTGNQSVMVTEKLYEIYGGLYSARSSDAPPGLEANVDILGSADNAAAVGEIMKLADEGYDDESVRDEAIYALDAVMGRLVGSEPILRNNVKKGLELMKVFANPKMAEIISKTRNDLQNHEEMVRVVQETFFDEVMSMVDREFKENEILDNSVLDSLEQGKPRSFFDSEGNPQGASIPKDFNTSTPDAVTYRSTDAGVEFVPVDPNNPEAFTKAKELNKGLGRAINQSIRAFAHLQGSTNYKAVWDKVAEDVLGKSKETQAGQDADTINVEDFLSKLGSVSELKPEEIDTSLVGKLSGIGFSHGKDMDKVEGIIIHHTAGHGNVNTVAKTLEERGLSVQYVVDRKGKVHQLMPDNMVAFHAGKHNTSGYDNENTIGIEVIANDDKDILPVQVEASKRLIKTLSERYGIDPSRNVFGHGEVASHKQHSEGETIVSALR